MVHASQRRWLVLLAVALAAILSATSVAPAEGANRGRSPAAAAAAQSAQSTVRFSTFNVSLNRFSAGELVQDLSTPDDPQAKVIAEIIQRVRPDVLLLNEFDYDEAERAIDLFHDNYLTRRQWPGVDPISYPHRMMFPSNTGVPSGFDLNRDGQVGGPDDAYGFGFFPGQYAFAIVSRYPIEADAIRTFQHFRWIDMPGALLPDDPSTPQVGDWYSDAALEVFRLSSKNHVDVPVRIGRERVHLLASHPTPPAFDGPERRNKLRNYDEIRLWADYITPGRGGYLYDDEGRSGGLQPGSRFIVLGDLNSDPCDGDSEPGAIQQLLNHPLVRSTPVPDSVGAVQETFLQGGINLEHCNPHAHDTADFGSPPGNLRVDYVLPRKGLRVVDAEVFWPSTDWEHYDRLIGSRRFPFPFFPSSDHKLVHIDVALPLGGRR